MKGIWLRGGWALALVTACGCGQSPPHPAAQEPAESQPVYAQRVDAPHLPNAYRLHAQVISGGEPDGEAAFQELQSLGVRTVISVDGARPDVELAQKYGLRYVHLPHGYDGISDRRAQELAKAVRDLPGAVYIHCHHGRHRSPTAATVACVALGYLDPKDARAVLKTAGTSENYRGLYAAVQSAHRLDDRQLDDLAVAFQETVDLPPMAEAMVEIEHLHDRLKKLSQSNWKPTADHPDLDPGHEALLLKEQFGELVRSEAAKQEPERFRELILESEQTAAELEIALREANSEADTTAAVAALDRLTQSCTACHREFRDVPLDEKEPRR